MKLTQNLKQPQFILIISILIFVFFIIFYKFYKPENTLDRIFKSPSAKSELSVENTSSDSPKQNTCENFAEDIKAGDKIGNLVVTKTNIASFQDDSGCKHSAYLGIKFFGSIIVSGYVFYNEMFDDICMSVDDLTKNQIPRVLGDERSPWFCFRDTGTKNSSARLELEPLYGKNITLEAKDYNVDLREIETSDTATLVRVIKN